jgi:hypothetical protein
MKNLNNSAQGILDQVDFEMQLRDNGGMNDLQIAHLIKTVRG